MMITRNRDEFHPPSVLFLYSCSTSQQCAHVLLNVRKNNDDFDTGMGFVCMFCIVCTVSLLAGVYSHSRGSVLAHQAVIVLKPHDWELLAPKATYSTDVYLTFVLHNLI